MDYSTMEKVYVPNLDGLTREILEEAHLSAYVVHSGSTKIYHDLKEAYWWEGMKKDVAKFMAKCLIC